MPDRGRQGELPTCPGGERAQPTNPNRFFTFAVEYSEEGWVGSMEEKSIKDLIELAESNLNPGKNKAHFNEALDACCDWFYPGTPDNKRPWRGHLGTKGDVWLRRKLESTWQIEWYWKVLLTSLPQLLTSHPQLRTVTKGLNIVIQLSIVRQWVMLTICRIDGQRQVLLRQPLFGRSHRLIAVDQYWVYLVEAERILKAWQHVRTASPIEKAYFLGRHDVLYKLKITQSGRSGRKFKIGLSARLDPTPYQSDKDCQNPDDQCCEPIDLITIPKFENKGELVENICPQWEDRQSDATTGFLLASDHVCESLELLSDAWNDPTIRVVHLNAPPGSGKEELSKMLYDCQEFKGKLAKVSLSPTDFQRNEETMFGKGTTVTGRFLRRWRVTSRFQPGLVEKARDGMLIVDEIDKAGQPTRASLLRLLESDEFLRPGSSTIIRMKDCAPQYVFLTSQEMNHIFDECPPRDFWTRLAFTIVMKNPFDISSKEERRRVIEQYFWLFWQRHIKKFFDSMTEAQNLGYLQKQEGQVQKALEAARQFTKDVRHFFESKWFTQFVSSVVSEELDARYESISVRNIRGIAERCVYKFAQWILYSRRFDEEEHTSTLNKCISDGYNYVNIGADDHLRRVIERIARSSLERRVDYPG